MNTNLSRYVTIISWIFSDNDTFIVARTVKPAVGTGPALMNGESDILGQLSAKHTRNSFDKPYLHGNVQANFIEFAYCQFTFPAGFLYLNHHESNQNTIYCKQVWQLKEFIRLLRICLFRWSKSLHFGESESPLPYTSQLSPIHALINCLSPILLPPSISRFPKCSLTFRFSFCLLLSVTPGMDQDIFLFQTPRLAVGSTSFLFDGYRGPFQWINWRKVDHSPQSNAELRNVWSYTSALPRRFHGVDTKNLPFFTLYLSPLPPKRTMNLLSTKYKKQKQKNLKNNSFDLTFVVLMAITVKMSVLLKCVAALFCRNIQTFRKNTLLPYSGKVSNKTQAKY